MDGNTLEELVAAMILERSLCRKCLAEMTKTDSEALTAPLQALSDSGRLRVAVELCVSCGVSNRLTYRLPRVSATPTKLPAVPDDESALSPANDHRAVVDAMHGRGACVDCIARDVGMSIDAVVGALSRLRRTFEVVDTIGVCESCLMGAVVHRLA